MKNEYVDELNKLLEKHGEALTAFYDEGVKYGIETGTRKAIKDCLGGFIVGLGAIYVTDKVVKTLNKKYRNKKKES